MFKFDFMDKLRIKLIKISKKSPKLSKIVNKKIRQIVDNDNTTIERYKNLKHNLSNYKRVHIDKHFVLTFYVDKEQNLIIFHNLDHHDKIY